MIRRIDIFMPPTTRYGMLSHITKELFEAMQRLGIKCRLLVAERNNPEPFLDSLFSSPPDCTLSFNGLLPDTKGNFFCEMIKIPHVSYLLNSPYEYAALAQSPWNVVVCSDVFSCHFFLGLGFDQTMFLPPGVDRALAVETKHPKKYDVVMLSTCIDYEHIRENWKKKYPAEFVKMLDNVIEKSMANLEKSLAEILAAEINAQMGKSNAINPNQINILELLHEIDMYIKGKDRIELVKALSDCKIDVFGSPSDTAGWDKYLKGKNVAIHGPIHYENSLEIMKQSKVVLSSCPTIKNGGDERVFTAMGCGALVVTNDNTYLKEHFNEGKDILFYKPGKWDAVKNQVQDCLSNPKNLEKMALKGHDVALKKHSWDLRAAHLIKSLSPMLQKIKAHV